MTYSRAFVTGLALLQISLGSRAIPVLGHQARPVLAARGAGIRVEFDEQLHTRIVALSERGETVIGPSSPSEFVVTDQGKITDFPFVSQEEQPVHDELGDGQRFRISGRSGALTKTVEVTLYRDFPQAAVFRVRYANAGDSAQEIRGWINNHYQVVASGTATSPAFWSLQSGSYENRPDWIRPLEKGFAQENFLGMNASDYGGGTPVVDVWRRDIGLAVGHLENTPKLVSLPVTMPTPSQATLAVSYKTTISLKPGESFETFRTFVDVHRGDYFQPLSVYRRLMVRQGFVLPKAPKEAFEPIWCAWGYGRTFTPEQVFETLPVARSLGFGWATLDDGWQVAEGDWVPDPKKFPRGDLDMKDLVGRIHAAGLKAQLWWSPLSADPGSALHQQHPEQLLLGADGSPIKISWWDAYYLCPAYASVRESAAAFVRKAMVEWGFDGLKVDGQHLNGAAPCFNPAHNHTRSEESVEGVPGFFKTIYDAALGARPDAVVEICPCGTSYSFFTMPYLNMTVASDPESSWQVRLKAKTLKALLGDEVAYFGDHVELSDGGDDFASTLGVGGVVGTQFAWREAPGKKDAKLVLTPQKERTWEFWVKLYQSKRLSNGEYLGGLYDIGFDRPETHVIRKDRSLYYAFFARQWKGPVELRGLASGRYHLRDYGAGRDLGQVTGPSARLDVTFKQYLLLEAQPEDETGGTPIQDRRPVAADEAAQPAAQAHRP